MESNLFGEIAKAGVLPLVLVVGIVALWLELKATQRRLEKSNHKWQELVDDLLQEERGDGPKRSRERDKEEDPDS